MTPRFWLYCAAVCLAAAAPMSVQAQDAAAAEALARKAGCMKCHAPEKKKDGPSMKEIAAKYKGKPDAEATLVKHATSNPKVKIDGKEEDHDSLKAKGASDADVRNVVRWYLSH